MLLCEHNFKNYMVWNPPRQEVNVTTMMIYSIIPIINIYSAWRIQKFWVIGGIELLVGLGLSQPLEAFLPVPFGYVVSFLPTIIIAIFFTRHFARKYNEKIKSS